ncbi:MAG TPA: hypothetical protein VG965_03230, partial [Patescibacteria group bacterium]|nr:hypothetical protein [Patescibacteria group bacterium]
GTTYYFCSVAQNAAGTAYGSVLSFATTACTPNSYQDLDGDGYGAGVQGCYVGGVLNNTDCDDTNSSIYQSISNLAADADQDRYYTGSPASMCVGAATPLVQTITYKSTSTSGVATGTSGGGGVLVNTPNNTANGDLLLMVTVISKAGGVPSFQVSTPTTYGYTLIKSITNNGGGGANTQTVTSAYYKIANNEPSYYQLQADTNEAVTILRYTGIDTSSPIDTSGGGTANGTNAVPVAAFAGPSVTTATANAVVFHVAGLTTTASKTFGVPAPASGWTIRKQGGSTSTGANLYLEVSDMTQTTPGVTGIQTSTLTSGTAYGGSIMFALKPLIRNYYSGASKNTIAQVAPLNPNTGSGNNLSIVKPSLISNGDMLVALLCAVDSSSPFNLSMTATPSAWVQIGGRAANNVAGDVCYSYYKPITSSGTEPSYYQWKWSEAVGGLASGTIITLDNASGGTIAYDTGLSSLFPTGTSTKTLTGITTSNSNETLLGLWGVNITSNFQSYTSPLSEKEDYSNSNQTLAAAMGLQAAAGASGNKNATSTNGGVGAGFLAAFYVTPGNNTSLYTDATTSALGGSDCAPNDNSKWVTKTGYPDTDGDSYTLAQQSVCTNGSLPTGWLAAQSSTLDCFDGEYYAQPGYPGGHGGVRGQGIKGNDLAGNTWDSGDWDCDGVTTYGYPYPAYSACTATSNAAQYVINNGVCTLNSSPPWPICSGTSATTASCGSTVSYNMGYYSNSACTIPVNIAWGQTCQ